MKHCPHPDVQFCPLYHAAHYPGALGCDDGQLTPDTCAVDRDLDYETAVAALNQAFVDKLKRLEEAARSRCQQERNRRAAGLR